MGNPFPSTQEFVDFGRKTCFSLFDRISEFCQKKGKAERTDGREGKDENNITTVLDKFVQRIFEDEIRSFREVNGLPIKILGEEIKSQVDMETFEGVVAFIDPIDGTDLVFRGFGNWCLALLFFYPKERRIIASFVGLSTHELFYATESGVWREIRPKTFEENDEVERRKRISVARDLEKPARLEQAIICFYGQKAKYFNAFAQQPKIKALLTEFEKRSESEVIDMRLYNFGGNPMIAKVASGDVDIVIGLFPQKVYDVIPAAYIARQAGALVTDLNGESIDFAEKLKKYEERVSYIVAGNRSLHTDVKALVQ